MLKLKTVKKIRAVALCITFALIPVILFFTERPVAMGIVAGIAMGLMLLTVIFTAIFYRCPACWRSPGTLAKIEYCQHCGEELDM